MKNFVLDASVALAWFFGDEATSATTALLEQLNDTPAIVPSIWFLEISNALVFAEQKKRLTYAAAVQFLDLITNLPIQMDEELVTSRFYDIFTLAHSEKLTTYDAAYLELAMRHGISLATKDMKLRAVAKRLGVKILVM